MTNFITRDKFDVFTPSFLEHFQWVYTVITRTTGVTLVLMALTFVFPAAAKDMNKPIVAIIGTDDMGNSSGPHLAGLGYPVVYGTRDPDARLSRTVAPCNLRQR